MNQTFGNINKENLKSIIISAKFKNKWLITKDKVKVCKDCEYRYICHDCRVHVKNLKDIYSQPAKCTYNPYIAKWQGEEGYISVEESLKIITK